MLRDLRWLGALAVLLSSLLAPAAVLAQPTLTPPRLLDAEPPAYPADADGSEPTLILRLTIDAEGRVAEAEVVEGAGSPFDEAALEAVRAYVFAPATRDGDPITARINFSLSFTAPAPAPVESPPDETEEADEAVSAGGVDEDVEQPGASADAADGEAGAEGEEPPELTAAEAEAIAQAEAEADAEPITMEDGGDFGMEATVSREIQQERGAEAVNVVDVAERRDAAADVGDVLARQEGVVVQRAGGLGSRNRFSLNGLYGQQIRYFVDGVPLELTGYPQGLANLPVDVARTVEIFRGVVPVRFGADALGGLVNLRSSQEVFGSDARVSLTAGSFDTYRGFLQARHHDEATGLVVGVSAYGDYAQNDFTLDVEVPDERGRLSDARVRAFHNQYRAFGVTVGGGFAGTSFAERLTLDLYFGAQESDIQNNVVMTVPYGEPTFGVQSAGGVLRYDQPGFFGANTRFSAALAVGRQNTDFVDLGEQVYDWFGEPIRERRVPGEIQGTPVDQSLWQWTVFSRFFAAWEPAPGHELRAAVNPRYETRTGDDRTFNDPELRDPLTATQERIAIFSGIEYQLDAFDGLLENIVFAKMYFFRANTEQVLPGQVFRKLNQERAFGGGGNALRLNLTDWFWLKASYEYAARIPTFPEIFGDGVLIASNLEIRPEVSHNTNIGAQLALDDRETTGQWNAQVTAFWRETSDEIVLLGNDRALSYQNVFGARTLGMELAATWTSPERYVTVGGNTTYVDSRNASSEGTFGAFEGDRLPSRPWFFANGFAAVRLFDLIGDDVVQLRWNTRFVREFFRGWESQGIRAFKQTVDDQLVHGISLSYRINEPARVSVTFDILNLTDARVFDFFGVQRPGRAFYLKVSGEL